jgi:porphobilinogen deaminase
MPDGSRLIEARLRGSRDEPEQLGEQLARALTVRGAREILDSLAEA